MYTEQWLSRACIKHLVIIDFKNSQKRHAVSFLKIIYADSKKKNR